MQVSDKFRFLHISDIHFNKNSGDVYDPDENLRYQVELDCAHLKKELGEFSGILITGDIAYSAEEEQYVKAKNWISKLSQILSSNSAKVWPTPGNHDVDRKIASGNMSTKDLHTKIRNLDPNNFDAELPAYLRDLGYREMFYAPLREYIKFAGNYNCEISPKNPIWIDTDLRFTDGTILSIRGLNSVLVSNHQDNDKTHKLLLGSHQLVFDESPNVVHLTLGHHPPDWLMDQADVSNKLALKTHIGLFGHKHEQWINPEQEGITDYIHITAGAVHPEREGTWLPRFNVLELSVEEKANVKYLCLKIYSRTFNKAQEKFVQDSTTGKSYREYFIKFKQLERDSLNMDNVNAVSLTSGNGKMEVDKETNEISLKVLKFNFLELDFADILSIGMELDLVTDADRGGLRDFEFAQKIIERAVEKNLLKALNEKILEKK